MISPEPYLRLKQVGGRIMDFQVGQQVGVVKFSFTSCGRSRDIDNVQIHCLGDRRRVNVPRDHVY